MKPVTLYKAGISRRIHAIDAPGWIKNGWSLSPEKRQPPTTKPKKKQPNNQPPSKEQNSEQVAQSNEQAPREEQGSEQVVPEKASKTVKTKTKEQL
ncbi:MAG: hypothetical protein AAFR89_08225 [Cyanobacteria bacterium J06633_1]